MLRARRGANIQRFDCYRKATLYFFGSTKLAYTAHVKPHSPLHIMYREKSIMSSRSCSQLHSELEALCEACRLKRCRFGLMSLFLSHLSCPCFALHLFKMFTLLHSVNFGFSSQTSFSYSYTTICIHSIFEKINYGLLKLAALSDFCLQ